MITFAKGVNSGTVPMGGVVVADKVHAAFMQGPPGAIELFHGYTYSAHPLACAAGLATLNLYRDEGLFARARKLEPVFAAAAMALKNQPNVVDIRVVGLACGIDLAPIPEKPGARATAAMERGFHHENLLVRITGDTLALSPPLVISESQIGELFEKVARVIQAVA